MIGKELWERETELLGIKFLPGTRPELLAGDIMYTMWLWVMAVFPAN